MNFKLFSFLASLLFSFSLMGQVNSTDYARADSVKKFNELVYHGYVDVHWMEDIPFFWYSVKTRKGTEYKMVDVEQLKITAAFDQKKLCDKINSVTRKKDYKPFELPLRKLKLINKGKVLTFEMAGRTWECELKKYQLKCTGDVTERTEQPYWGNTENRYKNDPVISPDSTLEACVKEFNLYVKNIKTGKEKQLSFDGSSGEFYSGHLVWAPDSRKIAINKVRINKKNYFYLVESSPENQIQAILHKREYLKPGDALPILKPSLFDVANEEQVHVDSQPFENQFDLSNLKWNSKSEGFTFEFNQRGHQLYQVIEVNASTGKTRPIIEEKSETFIDYSGKHYRFDVDGTNEIIWASERDGWNHLYLFNAELGQIKNQITKGEWVIRGVEQVDTINRKIIFRASGMNKGEDPYFIHYYSMNFDGSDLKDLTPERMNHQACFSEDKSYFVDTYSTPTDAPVTVLRKSENGEVLSILETADISDLLAENWRKPEVFVAKARDGVTDIWGNIYFPTNFDSTKSYPIIEYIYAGPQSSFTQKSFRAFMYSFTSLSELGFIVVQLDGMGTSNRSKAFQDVCFKNLKDAGFPDRIKWIKEAAGSRSFMDTTRVGIFGGSAGGQNSTSAVLFHPEFYKAAVSACGCHDNRMDKMWWNEQWMGFPIGIQYDECSNVSNAYRLQGELMLIVGELDDNVDPSSTMQVANALIKADKDFELVVLPGSNHTLGGDFGERKRQDFFVKTFYKQLPPSRNSKK